MFKVSLLLVLQKPSSITNSSGIKTELGYVNGGDVTISSIDVESDGLHIQVNHKNHGMYSTQNRVKLSDVQSDIKPSKLSIAA